jgi:hypothetical protein
MLTIPRLRIPVFVSAPSADNLNRDQEKSTEIIYDLVSRYKLEWRALGRSDYPHNVPLKEVLRLAKRCSGGIILGYEQFRSAGGEYKSGSARASTTSETVRFPTAWNNLEAGILFSCDLPIMIFREPGISGGVFDVGTTEVFVHPMPAAGMTTQALDDLDSVFQNWVALVRRHYYGD